MRKILLVLLIAIPCLASKVNPAEFTISATVTDVNSRVEDTYRSVNGNGHTRHYTIFVMTTEIGDKVYELQGRRLDVGTYSVKMKGNRIGFLVTDQKGKQTEVDCEIVGEHKK